MERREVTLVFPMPCDRCGRIMRPGETVVQRTYPTRTYVTHAVCPRHGTAKRRSTPTGYNKSRTDKQAQIKE